MIFKEIKEMLKMLTGLTESVNELRSLSVERSDFSRMYKRVNQIYFLNKENVSVSLSERPPVTIAKIMDSVMLDNDLTQIITSTYVSLSVLLRYSRASVQERELAEAISTLFINKEKFKLNYMNGYSNLFILSNLDIDRVMSVSAIFTPIEDFDKFTIMRNSADIKSISSRYPKLFISSTELSIFSVDNKEMSITEHPSFIIAALMYLMSDQEDLKSLVFLS